LARDCTNCEVVRGQEGEMWRTMLIAMGNAVKVLAVDDEPSVLSWMLESNKEFEVGHGWEQGARLDVPPAQSQSERTRHTLALLRELEEAFGHPS